MPVEYTVLASGSGGNACLIEADGFALLIDAGLGPRQLASRLAAVGACWRRIHAVLLTHTHGDHWNRRTLAHLVRLGIPLYCHRQHAIALRASCAALSSLSALKLLRLYSEGQDLTLGPIRCLPVALAHDGGPTFGFRFQGPGDLFSRPWAMGYASDLGSWNEQVAEAFVDVDLLAVEFNHDVALQRSSGRSPSLVARVLSDWGHLSNEQAAALLQRVLSRSSPGRLKQLVQLHLSRDCNRPGLALAAARGVLNHCGQGVPIHAASQDTPGPTFSLADSPAVAFARAG